MTRTGRHDALSLKRQRGLAALLLIANLVLAVACGAVLAITGWNPEFTNAERILCMSVFGVSWVALVIAAGVVEWLPQITSDLLRDAGDNARATKRLARFVAERRMVPYYVGLVFNLFGVALLAEFTGGLTESPFVALFVAFVLIGQQVSRFKLQATLLLVYGAVLVGGMLALKEVVSEPSEATPPALSATIILLSFVAGGLLNSYEKVHNYLVERRVQPPAQVRIYRDGRGIWRFALHRQDPVLLGPDPAPVKSGVPSELRERFEEHAKQMGAYADWGDLHTDWPNDCEDDSFIVPLHPRRGPT